MDLQPDGSWRPIRFPLPLGEPRDAPFGAKIHVSAIKRMQANPSYRPGCIIVGGGGRGTKVAPKEMGMGQWRVLRGEGDPVQEVYVRADIEERTRELVRRRTEEELGEMEKGGWRRGADAKERLKNQELGEEPGN